MKIYYHSNCPDGIISRELLKLGFPESDGHTYIPANYPFNPTPEPNTIFIDIAPDDESNFRACLEAGAIIGDHHESKREYFEKFFKNFSNQLFWGETTQGVSGAKLAIKILQYHDFIPNKDMYEIAEIVGIGDCYLKNHSGFTHARALAHYIKLFGNDFKMSYYNELLIHDIYIPYIKSIKKKAKTTPIYEIKPGLKVAFAVSASDSDLADYIRAEGANLIVFISYYFDSNKDLTVALSVRGDGSFNCAEFCKNFNGGGHISAAGGNILYKANGITHMNTIPEMLTTVTRKIEHLLLTEDFSIKG